MHLNSAEILVFSEIYARHPQLVRLSELEVILGASGARLRPALETLKEAGLILESEGIFEMSRKGLQAARERWA